MSQLRPTRTCGVCWKVGASRALLAILWVIWATPTGLAQDAPESWTSRLLRERQQKLATVQPAKVNAVTRFLSTVETKGFDPYLSIQKGHWRFGGGKLSPLSNFTPGISYDRREIGGSPISLTVAGAYSVRRYQTYVVRLGKYNEPAPQKLIGSGFFGQPFDFSTRSQDSLGSFLYGEAAYKNFPQEEFFGVGADSNRDNRSEFGCETFTADLVGGLQFARWLELPSRENEVSSTAEHLDPEYD